MKDMVKVILAGSCMMEIELSGLSPRQVSFVRRNDWGELFINFDDMLSCKR